MDFEMANENLDRLSPFDLMCKLISFPTVSCETNLPLVDWVEQLPAFAWDICTPLD